MIHQMLAFYITVVIDNKVFFSLSCNSKEYFTLYQKTFDFIKILMTYIYIYILYLLLNKLLKAHLMALRRCYEISNVILLCIDPYT